MIDHEIDKLLNMLKREVAIFEHPCLRGYFCVDTFWENVKLYIPKQEPK